MNIYVGRHDFNQNLSIYRQVQCHTLMQSGPLFDFKVIYVESSLEMKKNHFT